MAYGKKLYEIWREKVLQKKSLPSLRCFVQKPYTCLGDSGMQCDRDPKSWVAELLEQTGPTGTTVFPQKKMAGLVPTSDLSIGHSIPWVFWEDGEKRKKEKKRKCNKNNIDFSSILFRCFMLGLIPRLFENWKIITFNYSILQNVF